MQRQPFFLWFGGSCSRIVVLTTSLQLKDFVAVTVLNTTNLCALMNMEEI